MTDEEKAIEILNSYKNQLKDRKPFNCSFVDMQWAINIILDLIEKQENEINQLKEDRKNYEDYILRTEAEKEYKDKIKEKMNEIMSYTFSSSEEIHCQNYAYDRLKELLEETENG